jgi:hypothetical protein
MNEHELSKLLHEAAGETRVSSTAPRRVLRRARLRMATTGVVALSLVALLGGGAFALATGISEPEPRSLDPAQSPIVEAPDAPESDLVFSEDDGILLAEVQESEDRVWTFSGKEQNSEFCFNSVTHGPSSASGTGDCVNLGIPQKGYLGFLELDRPDHGRYEVLGVVSTEVRRLDFESEPGDRESVSLIDAPDKLGAGRFFFYLWLPRGERGTLEARDANGEVLQREQLCLSAGMTACSVGAESSASASATTRLGVDKRKFSCSPQQRNWEQGKNESGMTPGEAIQEWLDRKSIHTVRASDFEVERIGPGARELSLPANGARYSMVAVTLRHPNEWRGEQWKLEDVDYCGHLIDP